MNKVFRIEYNSTVGRHIVANQDIEPGSIIIDEDPIISGPIVTELSSADELVCLNCFHIYHQKSNGSGDDDNSYHICSLCKRNVYCSFKCANEKNNLHKDNECKVFQHIVAKHGTTTVLDELDLKHLYNITSIIRVLNIRYRYGDKWEQVCHLQSKVDEFTNLGVFDVQDKIFECLSWAFFRANSNSSNSNNNNNNGADEKESDQLIDIDENGKTVKEVARFISGVLRINSYACIVANNSSKSPLQFEGLYFFMSLVSHSCIMNTDRNFDEGNNRRIVVKAAVKIKKDEPITTTYLSLINNTEQRHAEMRNKWLFTCQCDRCKDETEYRSNLSTVTYSHFTEEQDEEDRRIAEKDILTQINMSMPKNLQDIQALETWLELWDTGKYFHHNHSIFIQVKLYLSHLYGRFEGVKALEESHLVRKYELCMEILQIYEIIYPGIYQCKGELLFELWITIREMNRRKLKSLKILKYYYSEDQAANEAYDILKFSIENSPHHQMMKILKEECSI